MPKITLPIAVLAALGVTSVAGPANAAPADHEAPRWHGHLPKSAAADEARTATPTMTVLGAPARSTGYTVRAGDTLSGISARTGVSVDALRRANGVGSNDLIRTGQRLTIPTKSSSTSTSTSTARRTSTAAGSGYSVRSGDTLSQIAQRRGVSLAALQAANPGINPSSLQVGQRLNLPSGAQKQAVGNTFAGRTYPAETTRAANANHATLAAQSAPSREDMKQTIADTARRHGVDPSLAQAVAFQESGFNQRAVSPANAVGAMQVTPSAGKWASGMAGRDLDLLNAQDNATAGVLVLRANLRAAGDERTALAAYYQGLSSVQKNGMYSDTKQYVEAVKSHQNRFR